MGNDTWYEANFFDGSIQDIKFYRKFLTASEVNEAVKDSSCPVKFRHDGSNCVPCSTGNLK